MNMIRVYLADGSHMQLEAELVGVEDGYLLLENDDGKECVAGFAHGCWRYWIQVYMSA
jgi:hypothetical protein